MTRAAIVLTLLAGCAGCDSSGLGRLAPVKGHVLLDGKPLPTGSLVFKPDAAKGNSSQFEPSATITADGSYSLFTKEKTGAPLGWYKVGVIAQEENLADPYAARKSLVASRYNNAETSGLAIEVVAAPASGAYDIKLAQ
jgi:hypothetical protein